VLETLAEAIELCGVPLALIGDNGTLFVTIVRTMLSRFERSLAELEIRHIRTQIDTPWTNGKDRDLLGDPPGRGPRPSEPRRHRRRRRGGHRLRDLRQLPPAARGARLADTRRAVRRDALHRPRLRARPGHGSHRRSPRRADGHGGVRSRIVTGEVQLGRGVASLRTHAKAGQSRLRVCVSTSPKIRRACRSSARPRTSSSRLRPVVWPARA